MFVVDTRLGNLHDDPDLAERVEREGAETITVDGDQRRRSRFRTETHSGREVGVVAEGAEGLRAGDVLAGDGELATVELAGREALAIDLSGVAGDPETLASAVALGHRVGNRHRPLATRGSEVLIAVDADAERTEAEVEAGLPDGATTRSETVDPTLFDRANAGHAEADHAHGYGDHTHSHGDHDHPHDHGDRTHSYGDHAHRGVIDRPAGGRTEGDRDSDESDRDCDESDRDSAGGRR